MPATYDDLLGRVRRLVDDLDRPPVVGISGHGGAGKSTLARRLGADLGLTAGQVVTLDRLYAGDVSRRGLLDLHDWPTVLSLLRRVRTPPVPPRLTYRKRLYDGSEGVHDVPMPPVVVVEGIRLLHDATDPLLDLAVWLDASPEAAGARAVDRNRRQGDDHAELDLWRTRWIPEGHAYERAFRPSERADLVLETR
jgi:uridine kinase